MMPKGKRIQYFAEIHKQLAAYSYRAIEDGVMLYFLSDYGAVYHQYQNEDSEQVATILTLNMFPIELEYVVEFFEYLLDSKAICQNGIVFTPKYISDYIVEQIFNDITDWTPSTKVLDPGCGCGIFLISAAEYIHKNYEIPMHIVIENNIYGFDIDADNVRRCSLVLKLLNAKYSDKVMSKFNIFCVDSLRADWRTVSGCEQIDFIIGNPPYVNPHDMKIETASYLREHFTTTKTGVFNIFYAFIEQSMKYLSVSGRLGFIVPNNFLSIKSAIGIRTFIQQGRFLKSIVDFGENMVFRPVRTYSSIIFLDKAEKDSFDYSLMPKSNDIKKSLSTIVFSKMSVDKLENHGWKLVDEQTCANLQKIESQGFQLKNYIRTGIATLKDSVYFVEHDESGYYKLIGKTKYLIEPGIVTSIYKIPELKSQNLSKSKRFIIFPYEKQNGQFRLISEDTLKEKYPMTYQYLLASRGELDKRDKGKLNTLGWYAYGRSQGLNKYGRKLLFPTFTRNPNFILLKDEFALFCNGYGVFEGDHLDLEIMCKILNSAVMHYYISKTSYQIEGGYYCYQKRYIERFSIPYFTIQEIQFIKNSSQQELDNFLIEKYGLNIALDNQLKNKDFVKR